MKKQKRIPFLFVANTLSILYYKSPFTMKTIIRFFTSIKLAIVLLIILAVASVIGTLIPQGRSTEEYAVCYGTFSAVLIRLQFTALYHSVWYIGLLAFFALNVIVCTLTRLSPKVRKAAQPHIESEAKGILALKFKDHFRRNAPLTEVKAEFEKQMAAARYRVRTASAAPSKVHVYARKRIGGIFGSDVVHAGLLVILAGGIVSGLASFRTDLSLKEGEAVAPPRAPFEVRLDKFATEFYADGNVKDWKSTLTVLEGQRPALTKVVEVNHPLSYKGFSFYQTSYGWNWNNLSVEIWARKQSDPGFSKKVKMKVGERVDLGDKDQTTIAVSRFLPDFVLGENNEPQTRSLQPNNPAALVEGYRGGEKIFSGWVFANFPNFAQMHSQKETDLAFELKSFEAGQYSVIEAARDPGANVIWIGCVLLMAGLALAFYWPTWEIRAVLEESQGRTVVTAGGVAHKSRDAFGVEFVSLMARLRRSK
jgi:cytochrome c biogenesis protein